MDWTEKKRREAEKTLSQWQEMTCDLTNQFAPDENFVEQLRDDVNTPGAIARLHELAKQGAAESLKASLDLLGVNPSLFGTRVSVDLTHYAVELQVLRLAARETKDFSEVDRVKSMLIAAGAEVRMAGGAVDVVPTSDFDPTKLEALK